MMKCVLIVTNFNAGRKRAVKYKKKIIDFVLKYTKSFKLIQIDELASIEFSQYDTILVLGGDGTVNKVIPYIVNTDIVLGIIPCGTANLLAAKLGLSYNLNKTLQIISNGNVSKVDVLSVNEKLSVLRCGFGFDSDIICKTPQSIKNKFGYFAYFIAGIIFTLRLKSKEYQIDIDGKQMCIKASCLIFANAANMYRDLISVANNSMLDDGLIDVFILKTTNPIIFFFELLGNIFNYRKSGNRAEYLQAKNIQLKTSWQIGHIDGEKNTFKKNINIKIKKSSVNLFTK